MPKLPGRADTRVKVPIERLAISSFFMAWEVGKWEKRICIVEGCDHRIGNCVSQHGGQYGMAVDEEQYQRDAETGLLKARSGPACSCCTERLLAS